MKLRLIVAQGNPEPDYNKTRHNIGFDILNLITDELNLKWEEKTKFNAKISIYEATDQKILFVKPTCFYNQTGAVIEKIIHFYKINSTSDLLVLHDDLDLDFGRIRTRFDSSDGGNNGIKSINSHIGKDYHRIRIGINNELRAKINDDAKFVLSRFKANELAKVKNDITPVVKNIILDFINSEFTVTSFSV